MSTEGPLSARTECSHAHSPRTELDRLRQAREDTEQLRRRWFAARQSPEDRRQLRGTAPDRPLRMEPALQAISRRPRRFLPEPRADANLAPDRYYTAITQRSPRPDPPFDALGRNCVPYPDWGGERARSGAYRRPDPRPWAAEIVKDVPSRGPLSIPVRVETPQAQWLESEDWNQTMRTMFKPVDRIKQPPKEYKVNPEWVSENDWISRLRAEKLMRAKLAQR